MTLETVAAEGPRLAGSTKPAATGDFRFRCTACGKCCNSPPLASLPELFHHQRRFIGCLAVQRVAPVVDAPTPRHRLPDDARHDYVLRSQAYGRASVDRCPALANEGDCRIHHDRKPAVCAVVPLEAALPDAQQPIILRQRAGDAAFIGAGCLNEVGDGDDDGFGQPLLWSDKRSADGEFASALQRRRADLRDDDRVWGAATFRLLAPALAAPARAIPAGGFMTVSLAPAIVVVAAVSRRCLDRCRDYIEAQKILIDAEIRQALADGRSVDRASTRELRGFQAAWTRLLETWQTTGQKSGQTTGASPMPAVEATEIERYLGI